MTARSLRVWSGIHTWTSLVCTGGLLMLCLTGLPLIFHEEVSAWLDGPLTLPDRTASDEEPSLDAIVAEARVRRPDDTVQLVARDEARPVWVVTFGATALSDEASATQLFDARTGRFLGETRSGNGPLSLVLALHAELLAGAPGTALVGAMGLVFVVSVISGVMLYGPFMRRLPFGAVRYAGSRRQAWLDLHNLLGIVTGLWVLVVGLTGVVNTLAKPLVSVWQATELAAMRSVGGAPSAPVAREALDRAVAAARAAEPDLDVSVVALPGTPFAGPHQIACFMRGTTPLTARLLKPVFVEASTGQLTAARDLPWYLTALLLSQPLHFGDYGGLPLKVIWALLDLVTIVVLVSGLYLWWKRRTAPMARELTGERAQGLAVPGSLERAGP